MHHTILLSGVVPTPLGNFLLGGEIQQGVGISPRKTWRIYGSYAVMCVLAGHGEYRDVGGIATKIGPGSVITVFPELGHWYGPARGHYWDEIYLAFEGPLFDLWRKAGLLNRLHPIATPAPGWPDRLRACIQSLSANASATERLLQVTAFQSLLAELAPASPSETAPDSQSWLTQACGLLEDSLGQPADLTAIAAQAGVSYETFRKRFHREQGTSPAQYRIQKRIEAACRLLAYSPQMTNRQIALALGFADEYHFSKRFSEVTGISPRDFRKQGARSGP